MKSSHILILVFILSGIGLTANDLSVGPDPHGSSQRYAAGKVSRWVMEKTAGGKESEFLVILGSQADLSGAGRLMTKAAKGRYVFETLLSHAQRSQAGILRWLDERKIEHRSFYIVNGVLVKGTGETALELAARSDVERIEGNPQLTGIRPVPSPVDERLQLNAASQGIETGISFIRAPEVWEMGFTGQGVVIGGQDTGVRWDHPALVGRYRGFTEKGIDNDYNWHDSIHSNGGDCGPDSKTPCDDDGHGTHTMGTAVGTDGGANQIGVAPGARFIACRNMDRGNGTPATYLECFQFFLAPYPVDGRPEQGDPSKAPDITTNSWTCPPSEGCEPDTLASAIKAQRAAGIMTIVAAGNAGSGCSTVVDPPAIYPDNYTIGALNASTGTLASFSSRGPVMLDGRQFVKPDLAAPGVAVRSSTRNGNYSSSSGTSMATPHVAGAVALLWSAFPYLRGQIEMTENILNESAVRIEETQCDSKGTPNNLFGYGRLDIKAAFDLAATGIETTNIAFGMRGGAGSINVKALPGVTWNVQSLSDWITVTSGPEVTGSGVVHFLVAANQSTIPRSGSLRIAGRYVGISQPGFSLLFAVSGRTTTDIGQPLARVTIRFSRINGAGEVPDDVETNDQGYWTQSGFEPGTTYRAEPVRSRIRFNPAWSDFKSSENAMNFSSVGRRVVLGSIR